MRVEPKDIKALIDAAAGRTPADLALFNVKFVNVFSGEVYPAVVYIKDGFVAHVDHFAVSPEEAAAYLDGEGRYLIPGFVDAHAHIESSMLVPWRFAASVVPRGTTTMITDPHELANVLGEEAVVYMHDAGEGLPMRQLIDIPSCVPAVPGLETAGAEFDGETVRRLAKLQRVVGLAEVMDFVGVAEGDPRMMDIIAAARECGLYIQGHAPIGVGRQLSAYIAGGPKTCHETRSAEDAAYKIRNGMAVDARHSSMAKNVEQIVMGVRQFKYTDSLCLCSDDRETADNMTLGHMDEVVRAAVRAGLSGVDAVRCATLNPARAANLENIGAVAPGYTADMLLCDDLASFHIDTVIYGGKVVAKSGRLTEEIPPRAYPIEEKNTLRLPALTPADFLLKAPREGQVDVNVLTYRSPGGSLTDCVRETLPVRDGCVDLSGDGGLAHVMILNRYGKGNRTLGVVRGFGLKKGANASTVSHDCHNLCVVYHTPEEGYAAVRALETCGGGMCYVEGGAVTLLPLPVGGLITTAAPEALAAAAEALKEALREAGISSPNPVLRIATMALPVIPTAKFSDLGLVDVMHKRLIPIFP
ncbi:MAG TPA: adenine deaminase C-terminal domain-containing protein [Candidatus Acidoferrum sp.]|nr:adenine deaminase C-terminal domain-containing protein [Candidatus Acidoferrum sp.]